MDHRLRARRRHPRVRNRWRLKLALRGAVVVVAGTCSRCCSRPPASKRSGSAPPHHRVPHPRRRRVRRRCSCYGLVRPLRRRVTDAQVAMYSRNATRRSKPRSSAPSKRRARRSGRHGALAAAGREAGRAGDRAVPRARRRHARSSAPRLQRHVVDARRRSRPSPRCSSRSVRRTCATACRRCSSSRAAPKRRARTGSRSRPGNTKVPRGADQTVKAKLVGFTSTDVERDDAQRRRTAPFERVPLVAGAEPGTFEGMLFHLEKPTEYYVESNGVHSPTFTLTVVDLPTVDEARCSSTASPPTPASPPRKVEPAATSPRSAAPKSCCTSSPTMTTPGGRILLNDGDVAAADDGRPTAR